MKLVTHLAIVGGSAGLFSSGNEKSSPDAITVWAPSPKASTPDPMCASFLEHLARPTARSRHDLPKSRAPSRTSRPAPGLPLIEMEQFGAWSLRPRSLTPCEVSLSISSLAATGRMVHQRLWMHEVRS